MKQVMETQTSNGSNHDLNAPTASSVTEEIDVICLNESMQDNAAVTTPGTVIAKACVSAEIGKHSSDECPNFINWRTI